MSCNNLTLYPGNLPNSGQTDDQNIIDCSNYMNWQVNTFLPEMNENMPAICAASVMGDMSKYLGEWGASGTPSSVDKGYSVSVGDIFYVSKIDNNTDTPPSANWTKLFSDYIREPKFISPLYSRSKTATDFDPNSVGKPNPDHINLLTRHQNCPDTSNFWYIETSWYRDYSTNCRQIAVSYIGETQLWVRSRNNDVWEAWEKVAMAGSQGSWNSVSMINGWTGELYYKKYKDDTVVVTGWPRNSGGTSGWANIQIGTLPAGFRPSKTIFTSPSSNRHDAGGVPRAAIDADGKIYCETIGDFYMNMTFVYKAEN